MSAPSRLLQMHMRPSRLSCRLLPSALHLSQRHVHYKVAVVGGGHAGCEAAAAAARMCGSAVLITQAAKTIGVMSCNPSFGGIGKGHLLREIDALDGVSPRICDYAGIQFRVLNRSKGPAVWGPRAQIDRDLYRERMQQELTQNTPGLDVLEATVEDLVLDWTEAGQRKVKGIITGSGEIIEADTVVITTGTFLRGEIHIGMKRIPAGRRGEGPTIGLANTLENVCGFKMGRLRTGTPPRLDGRTIDYSGLIEQKSENPPEPFSYMTEQVAQIDNLVSCHMTYTNPEGHKIVLETLDQNCHIEEEVVGPRYCPSIESKVLRFKDKQQHQVWLEPEGLSTHIVYPNGISMTMPEEAQEKFIRLMPGLQNVKIEQFGYGVAYDYVDPRELHKSLETKRVEGLFLAGQINGTTGYEEAASQGIIAGINAAGKSLGRDPFILDRAEAYIGVLIDDLVTNGVSEPYRMFTSRAEYRMTIRADNADLRLTEKGYQAGCVGEDRYQRSRVTMDTVKGCLEAMRACSYSVHQWEQLVPLLKPSAYDGKQRSALDMVGKQFVDINKLMDVVPELKNADEKVKQRIFIEGLYDQFRKKQDSSIQQYRREEQLLLPVDLDYSRIPSLPREAIDALSASRPTTLGAAGRLRGMTPASTFILLQYVRKVTQGNKRAPFPAAGRVDENASKQAFPEPSH
eukprot:m.103948 g.103948  ORF g.103948 m.103948 type:complete len:685 (-) comp15059_c1_seq1:133-2187(-)